MSEDLAIRYSDDECVAELDRLFPSGPGGEDVLRELAPGGWEASLLRAVFHPDVEQRFAEALRMHEGMLQLLAKDSTAPPRSPTLEEIRSTHIEKPHDPRRECTEVVGMCLWDIFSDNHDVRGPDGRSIDLGSFRGTGGFLADWINGLSCENRYDYLDFYMGSMMVSGRADLTPVYELIFRRFRSRGLDWAYQFPRLYLVDLRGLRPPDEGKPEFESYDPSESFARQEQEREKSEEIERMRADMDEDHREAVEQAGHGPPPKTVGAYRAVYGRFPTGWPPRVDNG